MSNNTEMYSPIDRLNSKANRMFGASNESTTLTAVVILSGVLSALFFWQFASNVFGALWPPAAIMLGLAVGLMPSEGAYFGWRNIRASKTNLTSDQLKATKWGLVASVVTSIFSTFSLFVVTVPFVPAVIREYGDWFVFIALSLPILIQFAIIAYYELNSQSTTENFKNAELDALGFASYIDLETARKMAIIESAESHLEREIKTYADGMGEAEIAKLLAGNSSKSIGQHQPRAMAKNTAVSATIKKVNDEFTIDELNIDQNRNNRRFVICLPDGTHPYLSQDSFDTAASLAISAASMTNQTVTVEDRQTGEKTEYHPN